MSERLWRREGARVWAESYLVDLSAHGLYRLTATAAYLPGIIRLLWCLLFAGALGYSLRQCAVLLQQYQSNDLDVSVDFSFNKEVIFPAITICNLNALRSSAVISSRFHSPLNDSTTADRNSTSEATVRSATTSSLPPTTKPISTDPTINPRLYEVTMTPTDVDATPSTATTPDPELTENFAHLSPTGQGSHEPSLGPPRTGNPVFPVVSRPLTVGTVAAETRPTVVAATTDDDANGTTLTMSTTPQGGAQTQGRNESGSQSSGTCSLLGVQITPIPGLSCALLAVLFGESGKSDEYTPPTLAPVKPDYVPDDFFQTDSSGLGSSASQVVLDLAEKYESENSSASIFSFVFDQTITIVKHDTTRHKVNFDFTQPPVLREEVRLLGHQLEDMMISCQWEGLPCYASNFTQFQNGHYGNCYTFNSGKNGLVLSTQHVGPSNGLIVEFDLEQYKDYIGQLSAAAGLRVSLHRQGENTFPEDDGFNIPPAYASYVGIRQVVIERRGEPYSNCRPPSADSNNLRYTKWNCLRGCLAKYMFSECGCVDPVFLNLDYPLCHTSVDTAKKECLERTTDLFRRDAICKSCPDPCQSLTYRKKISMERWPSKAYESKLEEKLLALNKSFYDFKGGSQREDYARLIVYFEEFNYQRVTERPAIELADLLSSIGGTLGLYVGMSVLSIAEFVDIILNLLLFAWKWLLSRLRLSKVKQGDEKFA